MTQAKPTKQTQTESIQLEIQFNFTVKISNWETLIRFKFLKWTKVKLKDEKEKLIFILYKIHYYKDNLVIVSIGLYVVE